MKSIRLPRTAYCLLPTACCVGVGGTLRLPGKLRQEVLCYRERKD
jgi:hypothetical protein